LVSVCEVFDRGLHGKITPRIKPAIHPDMKVAIVSGVHRLQPMPRQIVIFAWELARQFRDFNAIELKFANPTRHNGDKWYSGDPGGPSWDHVV